MGCEMADETVDELIARGSVRRAEPDADAARRELSAARLHLESAATLMSTDPTAAFAIVYEATRKAISAHMRLRGLRVSAGAGAHARIGRYAVAALDDPAIAVHVKRFDDLRKLRNQSAYEGLLIEPVEVAEALVHAEAIVSAVAGELGE